MVIVSPTFVMFVSFSEYYKRFAEIPFMVGLANGESLAEDLLFWEKDLSFPLALKVRYFPLRLTMKR